MEQYDYHSGMTPKAAAQDMKERTIAQQEAKMETYIALKNKGLPIPLDLKAEVERHNAENA